jgi:Rrf2 family protein
MLLAASEKPVDEAEISREMQIPQPNLADVMSRLENVGFVCESERSGENNCGYKLAKSPEEISLWKMLEAEDEKVSAEPDLPNDNQRVKELHKDIHKSLENALKNVTLEHLVKQM